MRKPLLAFYLSFQTNMDESKIYTVFNDSQTCILRGNQGNVKMSCKLFPHGSCPLYTC